MVNRKANSDTPSPYCIHDATYMFIATDSKFRVTTAAVLQWQASLITRRDSTAFCHKCHLIMAIYTRQ